MAYSWWLRRPVLGILLGGLLATDAMSLTLGDLPSRVMALAYALTFDELLLVVTIGLGAGWLLTKALNRVSRRKLVAALAGQQAEQEAVRQLALCDPLTGLLNRRGLEEGFARPPCLGEGRAVVLCDLDGFKHVNDTLGHAAGDDVLRRFAKSLSGIEIADGEKLNVRLGGDEFVILITAQDADKCSVEIARSITAMIEDPNANWPVSVSIGIAKTDSASQLEDLLIEADTAMYGAKRSGQACRVSSDDNRIGQAGTSRIFEQTIQGRTLDGAKSLFTLAIGITEYRRIRQNHGNSICGKLIRSFQQQMENIGAVAVERMAPDTIGVLIEAFDIHDAAAMADRLRRQLQPDPRFADLKIDLKLMVGVAGPSCVTALREYTEMAQDALDEAWRTGEPVVVCDVEKQAKKRADRTLMNDLDEAITSGRLDVHYQPKLCSKTGEIHSLEALVRWNHPVLGAISPGRFVPIAEETGHIRALTDWVIEQAIDDCAKLEKAGVTRAIYVNISAQLIGQEDFTRQMLHKIAPLSGAIGIEITETALLFNPDEALRQLRAVADAGISIAIDDYGAGLSSLTYLKQLPATELKIDMSFITGLADSHRDPMIVRSTIDLAHGLGLKVTAEGVDNPLSLGLLRVMGCDLLQGFQISQALPLEQIVIFLKNHNHSAHRETPLLFTSSKLPIAA